MPSQFFGLNIAYTGLLASNAWLNTTANNIANVQTEGYSRQSVTTQAANALRVFQKYGCAGAGVETLAVERVRDEFYDFRYWSNNDKVGEYSQKQYYMQQIESYFHDDGENAGFKTVFDQLMITGLQELMKNPNNDSFKEQFVGYAEALTEYFNNVSGNLEKLQKDVNEEIKVKVDEINTIANEIASLNKQINTIEYKGIYANELRDRRTLLLDQLSEIVDVEIKETKIADTNNPGRETGGSRFIVKIAGGQVLVDGYEYNGLECVSRTSDEKVNQTDVDGLYDVKWAKTGSYFSLHSAAMGGALKGLVDLRDGNNGEGFTGVIDSIGTDATTNKNTVTVNVDKHYLTDLNKCNLSDTGGVVSLGNKNYYYDSWTYSISYNAQGEAEYSYTFELSGSPLNTAADFDLLAGRKGMKATVGDSISYQGVPYYMSQMNEWIRTFSQKFNDILTGGFSGDQPGIPLFTANMTMDNGQYVFDEKYRYDKFNKDVFDKSGALHIKVGKTAKADEASYYLMTAQHYDVSQTMVDDPSRLANKKKLGDGADQNDLLEDLKDLATNKGTMSFRGSSASEFLQCILADVALNTSRAETFYSSYADISYNIETQRISISGVDEDEEAVNLVKYQNGYNLASKMIQTLTEIYDRLILQTGV